MMLAAMMSRNSTATKMAKAVAALFDTNQRRAAKHSSVCTLTCDGIQVAMSMSRMTPKQIATSYFLRAAKASVLRDRMAHSKPKTT